MPSSQPPIVALCLEYSIFAFGGTEVLVAELIRQLARDFSIVLVSRDESVAGTWVEPLVRAHRHWQTDVSDPRELVEYLAQSGAGLVHFHLGDNYCWRVRDPKRCAVTLAGHAGLTVLTTNHGFFSPLEGYVAHYRPRLMKLALFPAAWLAKLRQLAVVRAEIAVSQNDYRGLRHWYAPFRARFGWIYHSKLPAKLPANDGPRRKVILCVGTIGPRKGQPVLVEAFARIARRHPEWTLELAGRASDPGMMASIAKTVAEAELKGRVTHVEGLSDPVIIERLATSEIFAMPSLYEGLGLSLQEALFHGCACIATRCGGPEDLIEDEVNGLLVPRADVDSLAGALDRLISQSGLRAHFRQEGPASVRRKQMSGQEMAGRYRALYGQLYGATGSS